MKVLLIEDSPCFARPIKGALEAAGHAVTWIIGAERVEAHQVIGILPGHDAPPTVDSWDGDASRLVAVGLSDIDFALIDGGLAGPVKCGADIIPTLVDSGILCAGISGAGAANPLLTEAGARLALPKEYVVLALRAGVLNLPAASEQPEQVAEALRQFTDELRSRHFQSRKGGQRLDLGYPDLG